VVVTGYKKGINLFHVLGDKAEVMFFPIVLVIREIKGNRLHGKHFLQPELGRLNVLFISPRGGTGGKYIAVLADSRRTGAGKQSHMNSAIDIERRSSAQRCRADTDTTSIQDCKSFVKEAAEPAVPEGAVRKETLPEPRRSICVPIPVAM
jgi:hypothetical protein